MSGGGAGISGQGRGGLEVPSGKDWARRPLYSAGTGACTFVQHGIRTETGLGELVKYDARALGSATSLARLRGTVLSSRFLWLHVGLYVGLAVATCLLVLALTAAPQLIRGQGIAEVVDCFALFVTLALAFHTALAVARWWEVRSALLGELWRATNDLTMVLAVHFPSREHRRVKTLVLRYCLLSFELLFMQARDGEPDMVDLGKRQLLRDDERERLEQLSAKPQVVWVWIAATFQRLAAAGKLPSRLLATLYEICMRARGAVGGVFTHMDTQLPLSYVHLISVVVHANAVLVAAKCGIMAAVAVWHLRQPGPPQGETLVPSADSVQSLLLQCGQAALVPMATIGFLEVGLLVADPLGSDVEDFPRSAYHMWLRDECEAFHTAAEEAPREIARAADGVEARPPHVVQDRVCAV